MHSPKRAACYVSHEGTVALRRRMSSPCTKAATRTFRDLGELSQIGHSKACYVVSGRAVHQARVDRTLNATVPPGDLPDHHLPTRSQAISGLTSIRASVPFPALIAR